MGDVRLRVLGLEPGRAIPIKGLGDDGEYRVTDKLHMCYSRVHYFYTGRRVLKLQFFS